MDQVSFQYQMTSEWKDRVNQHYTSLWSYIKEEPWRMKLWLPLFSELGSCEDVLLLYGQMHGHKIKSGLICWKILKGYAYLCLIC